MSALIEAKGVTKRYGSFTALDDVTLTLSDSEPSMTAVAGESGSGKTTLARMMLGFIDPTEGSVEYRGKNIATMSASEKRAFRREVQPVFQDPFEVFNPFYRIDNVLTTPVKRFRLADTDAKAQALIEDALERVGLRPQDTLGRFPHELSGGQRQRVMVARAVLLRPKMIVADEPVSMVDASLRATILDELRTLNRELGISIVYTQTQSLRDFDATMRQLVIDPSQPAESRRFQLAHQLAALALAREIAAVVETSPLRTAAARQLLHVGLANYAAGAVLMPYAPFRASARAVRHDIDRLRMDYGVSFEQACHRLSTLQRPGARGIPMFFCRVDMAGNITKRHSATRLQFARFGGACPLWIVHEAAAIPDRILFQLAETPDGLPDPRHELVVGVVRAHGAAARTGRLRRRAL